MLELVVETGELYDESTNVFVEPLTATLLLEHSLVSLSKWESFFKKPFLSSDKSREELIWYIKAMNQNPNVPPEIYSHLEAEHFNKINAFINDPMTAAWFNDEGKNSKTNSEVITAELLYYWMIAFTIPIEMQHWHLNRLLALIRTCNVKNGKPKKMSRREAATRQREINERRLRELGTTG